MAFSNMDLRSVKTCARDKLDWSNRALAKKFHRYTRSIKYYQACVMRLDQSITPVELAIVNEIRSKSNQIAMMDDEDIYSSTKSERNETDGDGGVELIDNDWKLSYENHYRNDPRFKEYKIDIGDFEAIEISSNPKHWTAEDVRNYLSNDSYCMNIAKKLHAKKVDGVAFMLLDEELLLKKVQCRINLTIRLLCHISEVQYQFLSKHCNS